ncbi:MAG: type I restriction endonuclease [Methylococcales bacterium]
MPQDHHEIHLEAYITQKLIEQGWLEGQTHDYDIERALYPEDVVAWVQTTQANVWHKLVELNGERARTVLLDRVAKTLNEPDCGTLYVLRNGVEIAGVGQIDLSQKQPEDERNATLLQDYAANRLRVVRQLKYSKHRNWEIDLAFFINGIAVATAELKTDFTQDVESAMRQYREDRLPKNEPLLTYKRGAVVHFAVSESDIRMTTQLAGANTIFLPFNQGNNGHVGNPARADGEYPIAYFWEQVCQPQTWLRIFHNFVYEEKQDKVTAQGKAYTQKTQIFPRFHQLQAVNLMLADAKANGAGQQYLCEHSAGSGKTSTIAWTCHDLIRLRSPDGKAIFDSVIVVSDRNVLDAQLQDAVQQIDHDFGTICAIDREQSSLPKSKQLAQALIAKTPIIVVTIQTFPYALEAILTEKSLATRQFAVIIDEAHNSQTGSTAQGLRAVLAMESRQNMDEMTVEDLLLAVQKSRVRPSNVSHFAFTATPKHSTLTLFGRIDSVDNKPKSFHLYTMRQAIEEGFILDVLENYTPYSVAYNLQKTIEDDKRVDKKYARRALAKWVSLNEVNITEKVEFILQHFSENVARLLNGEAKAMVVTSGRAEAVKYKLAFEIAIKKQGLQNIRTLVAFSGKVSGKKLGEGFNVDSEKEYTETNLNPEIGSLELRKAFEQQEYRLMLVANKFQTGFNQPKLVAMYLDKKISGVEAVQTLSRLNRTYSGKDQTFVIDFANEADVILSAFKQYDDGATVENVQDLDVVYELKRQLDSQTIYNLDDLDTFKKVRAESVLKNQDEAIHKRLYATTQRPSDVFNGKLKNLIESIQYCENAYQKAHKAGNALFKQQYEQQRSEYTKAREALMLFKTRLGRFVRVYSYIAQLIFLDDAELENFAAFAKLLAKRLQGITPEQIDLSALMMTGYEIKPAAMPDGVKEDLVLKPIKSDEGIPNDREKEFLQDIIQRINNVFGNIAPINNQKYFNFAAQIAQKTRENNSIVELINANNKEDAINCGLPKAVTHEVNQARSSHDNTIARMLFDKNNPQAMKDFVEIIYDLVKKDNGNNILGM